MRIAIIGAGFSGLGAAWHLLKKGGHVEIFDPHGVGGGASGVATGLMHPYPSQQGRRSWKASEGLLASRELLEISEKKWGAPVADFNGVLRSGKLLNPQEDVDTLGEDYYLIKSGVTVFTSTYLQGLWKACEDLGAVLHKAAVSSLQELEGFDQIVIAAGPGSFKFEECRHLKVNLIKGQALICRWPVSLPPLERSWVGKGYVAKGENREFCQFGATYERNFSSTEPDMQRALEELRPKMATFPFDLEVVECKAGIRVSGPQRLPIMEKVSSKAWVLTAMGSRGLLYHAYFGKTLAENIFHSLE